ncbi:unnamed protein product [Phyllotreta striolata]|uniref:ADP/ATP translocase n=1 Tax=Phyllotreta striolata TaxID=444603 RepID=A0A9N9TI39_PHYSR|nr:unnamed protein product [Phyllotreta striolata]
MTDLGKKFEDWTHVSPKQIRDEFLTAGTSSALVTFIEAPMDRVKLLLQIQPGTDKQRYKGIVATFLRIPREHGFRTYWRGSLAKMTKAFPNAAFNFTFNSIGHRMFVEGLDREKHFWSYFFRNLGVGGLAGASALTILFPIEFTITRTGADVSKQFTGPVDCVIKTLKAEGPFGVYRGYMASIQGVLIYRSTYFGLYDTFKYLFTDTTKAYSISLSFLIASSTTTLAAFLAYPFDTVRRRMIMQAVVGKANIKYKNLPHCWKTIYKEEGIRGFYKGSLANMILGFGAAVLLVVFDVAKQRFKV